MWSQIQALCQHLIDFKKFLHEEIITVKSMITDKRTASPERDVNEPAFQKSFIKSLEDRISSLEKQSCEKKSH